MKQGIRIDVMRSQLGRARGLGASHSGVHHWYVERVTALALIPLTLWFIYAVVSLAGAPHATVLAWAHRPVNAALLLALVAMTFHHMQLGVQVILQDYVNATWLQSALILATKAVALVLALLAAVSVLKMAL